MGPCEVLWRRIFLQKISKQKIHISWNYNPFFPVNPTQEEIGESFFMCAPIFFSPKPPPSPSDESLVSGGVLRLRSHSTFQAKSEAGHVAQWEKPPVGLGRDGRDGVLFMASRWDWVGCVFENFVIFFHSFYSPRRVVVIFFLGRLYIYVYIYIYTYIIMIIYIYIYIYIYI